VDYGKDEVAGILKASSREEAWVLDDGNRHRAPEPPATLAKTTTAMLVNLPLSNRNPDCTPEYRQVLQVHYLLSISGSRYSNRSSLRRIAVSGWINPLAVCSSPGLLGQ
jgi:hypothetical protein